MKDNIEIGHVSNFDAFRSNRDQVTEFKTVKILILRMRPPKPYKLINVCTISIIFINIGKQSDFHLNYFQIVGPWHDFPVFPNLIKKFWRVFMVLGNAASRLQTFVWIFNYVLRSVTWSLFDLKPSNLDRWPISMLSFMWWCHCIDCLKFETRPSSLRHFVMVYRGN